MVPILPAHPLEIHKTHVNLISERRGLKGMAGVVIGPLIMVQNVGEDALEFQVDTELLTECNGWVAMLTKCINASCQAVKKIRV